MTFLTTTGASTTNLITPSKINFSILDPLVPNFRFGHVQRFESRPDTLVHRGERKIYEFQASMGSALIVLSGADIQELDLLLLVKNTRQKFGPAPDAEPLTHAISEGQEKHIQIDGLGSGTYYIMVQKNSSARFPVKYDLAIGIRENVRNFESEPNNTLHHPDFLDGGGRIPLVGARHLQGHISYVNDQVDYWRFQLDKPSYLEGYLEIERGVAELEIFDANQNLIKRSRTEYPEGKAGLQCDRIPPGTYYARIRPIGPASTRYRLRLEGHPVYAGNLTVQMHRITALDDFERVGQRQADFYYRLTIDGGVRTSQVFQNKDEVIFAGSGIFAEQFSRRVNINKRIIPFSIELFEQDTWSNTTADISPNPGQTALQLSYDTLTGEISGKGLRVRKEGQKITVQGDRKPRARVTFEVNYTTLSTGEVEL